MSLHYSQYSSILTLHMCVSVNVSAHLPHLKLKKLACTCTVACNFGMYTIASEHIRHTSDAHHELTLGLPHYTCGVQVATVDTYRQ